MKFGIVSPDRETFELLDFVDIHAAEHYAGLKIHEVDHGSLTPTLGIIVGEFGLFEEKNFFFTINQRLYAGAAVIYAHDEEGNTVDMEEEQKDRAESRTVFYSDSLSVENAIRSGKITRPILSINGAVYWQWPNSKPDWMK